MADGLELDDVRAVLEGDDDVARGFLRLVTHPADIVEVLTSVDAEHWPRLLDLLDDEETRADVVALMDDADTDALLEHLGSEAIPALVREMETDDAADLLAELSPKDQRDALAALDDDDRRDVERLMRFQGDSAGGIMQTEVAVVPESATVDDAVRVVRHLAEEGVTVHRVYVTGQFDRLLGSLPLVDLLLYDGGTPVRKIISPLVATVTPDVDQEEVARIFQKYDLITLPVIDSAGRVLGRIVHDDVVDVLEEEAEEDALRMAGTAREELLYRDRALPIARVRLPWIVVNLVGSLVSAFVLALYDSVLVAGIFTPFIPVITAMCGNVGTQSATIFIQGLAKDKIKLSDVPRMAFKELRVGLVMGLVCGVSVAVIATIFFDRTAYLGLAVFISMLMAMSLAAVSGTLVPAVMKKLGVDPVIAASPLVTTMNDIFGITTYMTTALFFLDKIGT